MNREKVLKLLASEFSYTQALHVEKDVLIKKLNVDEITLDDVLASLEEEGFVNLNRNRKGKIKLAKITWQGLNSIGDIEIR